MANPLPALKYPDGQGIEEIYEPVNPRIPVAPPVMHNSDNNFAPGTKNDEHKVAILNDNVDEPDEYQALAQKIHKQLKEIFEKNIQDSAAKAEESQANYLNNVQKLGNNKGNENIEPVLKNLRDKIVLKNLEKHIQLLDKIETVAYTNVLKELRLSIEKDDDLHHDISIAEGRNHEIIVDARTSQILQSCAFKQLFSKKLQKKI